eukprot:Seg3906.3 transcript_id=Seg3906.3/GoldUCD/mRNA.D3Y31 product="Splicing factor ESS-2" protein_id=Seg3906.3/GoldUCD/D3Y31
MDKDNGNSSKGKEMQVLQESKLQLVPTFKDAKSRVLRKQNVLEEDAYIEAVDKIIERDFFPDLQKLQLQAEYLDALSSNDIDKLRSVELKLDRGLSVRRFNDSTPSTFETPSTHRAETPSSANTSIPNTRQNEALSATVPNVSLDNFLAKNTSEDNASFEKIMEESKHRIREKFAWLFQAEDEQGKKQDQNLALPSCEEQVLNAIDDKPYNLDSWTYKSRNALMYVPNGVELSAKELIEGKGRKERVIKYENTRFDGDPFNSVSCRVALNEAASEHANIKKQVGKIGADGNVEAATPKVKGYGFVATPSPAPGVDASPFMTWGEIEGTPMRLDATPGPAKGPTFKIPEQPRREQLGHQLVEKMSKQHRDKRRDAIARAAASLGKSPGRLSTDRITQLSPAAQRLVKSSSKLTADSALRSSYSPSPHRKSTPLTPSSQKNTPNTRSNRTRTPGSNRTEVSLTDNLLQLPKT